MQVEEAHTNYVHNMKKRPKDKDVERWRKKICSREWTNLFMSLKGKFRGEELKGIFFFV